MNAQLRFSSFDLSMKRTRTIVWIGMALEIVNAKETRLKDDEIRMLAEIEEHPEIAKWDIPAFGGVMEKRMLPLKSLIKNFLKAKMNV